MNVVKAKAIVIVVTLVAALVGASASAQQPTPAATSRFTISEKPPQFWAAEGGTQASWMAFRQRCADIAAELARRQGMTYKQLEASPGLSFSRGEWLRCGILSPSAGQAGPALSPSTSSAATPPTPMPTPLPPDEPQSLAPDTPDPPTIGSSYAGGSASAPALSGATPPTPLPHVHMGIPVTPPPGWMPKQWADLRARCQDIADKAAAHRPFTRGDWSTAGICGSLGVQPPPPNGSPSPILSGVSAPMVTPEPSPSPAGSNPQSALDPEFLAALRMIESRRYSKSSFTPASTFMVGAGNPNASE